MHDIPLTALLLEFMEAGEGHNFANGWVHTKTAPFTIVALPCRGRYEITCRSELTIVRRNEAFVLGANHPVSFKHLAPPDAPDGTMSACWLHLHFSLYRTIDFTSLLDMPLKLRGGPASELGNIVQELLRKEPAKKVPLLNASRRTELAFQVLRILCEASTMKPTSSSFISATRRLHAALLFVQGHLQEDLTVARLAETVHMSPSRFHTVFREQLGLSPMAHVKKARLSRAQHLLATSERSVYEIAEAVGFKNQFHFSRAFKGAMGITPSEFRKRHAALPHH